MEFDDSIHSLMNFEIIFVFAVLARRLSVRHGKAAGGFSRAARDGFAFGDRYYYARRRFVGFQQHGDDYGRGDVCFERGTF